MFKCNQDITVAVTTLLLLIIPSEGSRLQPLVCNSVNELPNINEPSDYVYVTSRGNECTFVFEGPPEAQLDLKVHSFTSGGSPKNTCKNPPVRVFAYSLQTKLRQLEKVLCAPDDAVRSVMGTNTAIITSALRYGSFFVRVRPIPSHITPRLHDQTNQLNNVVNRKRSDFVTRRRNDLIRFGTDYLEESEIDGMHPPDLRSIDFFAAMNQFEIPLRFRAQPQGFMPSVYYPSPDSPRPTDSYGAPVTSGPILWGPYPGQPGKEISITSTQKPTEWISGSGIAIVIPGYPNNEPTMTTEDKTERPTEETTTIGHTRYTEPLTSPSPEESTTPAPLSSMKPAPTSSIKPEKVTDMSTDITTVVNSTTVEETETRESETPLNIGNEGGFTPMIFNNEN